MNWNKIINWKLLAGSHDFPGPDGGTCINEAAIIAAGFKYMKVRSAADCPPCFSPVLSNYLIGINDMLPDAERQKLMRFILRLSGSADTPAIEQQRLELIVLRTVQIGVSSAMRAARLPDQAAACAAVKTFAECGDVVASAASAAWAAGDASAASAAWAAWAASAASAAGDASAASAAGDASAAWAAGDARRKLYADCIAIAEEAFAIGNQASAFDTMIVTERLERARSCA